FGSKQLPAPQASLMELVAKGVLMRDIPFMLVFIGGVIGLLIGMLHLPILPVAIGLYLPLSLTTAMMIGGVLYTFVEKIGKTEASKEKGLLASSGLIAGDACAGVVIAFFIVFLGLNPDKKALLNQSVSLLAFLLLSLALVAISLKKQKGEKEVD
ncbi:oligopeptide transporter, OPT family, partial [bacterium]|nr:oligopeptide transporter, OPT family [bacterium]